MADRFAISVAISTFNRIEIVPVAVRSALEFVAPFGGDVVVVDDGSSDETGSILNEKFSTAISDGLLRVVRHDTNQGVTAAKNTGFSAARGDWVLFLDSDDTLLADASDKVAATLAGHPETPLVFFRCVDEAGHFVGHQFELDQSLVLRRYLEHTSYGEALVAVNKRMVRNPPFDADLRGYEGLGCARIIKEHGAALLSTVVARRYDRSRNDRLSAARGFLSRMRLIGQGHFRLIATFWQDMSILSVLAILCKAVMYNLGGILFSRDGKSG